MQQIKTISESDEAKFDANVQILMNDGYRISSTSSCIIQSESYGFMASFMAILIKG